MSIKLIRNSVFETNSSSCHSISLSVNNVFDDTIIPDGNGVITVSPGEFGWEICQYTDAETKLSYAWTWAINYANSPDDAIDYLTKLVCEYTGATKIEYQQLQQGFANDGYIDYQSSDVMEDIFFDPLQLKQFLFSTNSILYTDNDNH